MPPFGVIQVAEGEPMPQINDLSRSLTVFEQDRTLVVVIEVSLSSWLVADLLPGVPRQPRKKLDPDQEVLFPRR
jgi:transposase